MILRRMDTSRARFVYDRLMEHRADMSIHIEAMSFDDFMRSVWPNTLYFGLWESESGDQLAIVTLANHETINRSMEFGVIALLPNRGYGQKALALLAEFAFRTLGLHRIYAWVNADNVACLRMAERSGIRREGRSVASHFKNGSWVDQILFAVTADEENVWQQQPHS